MSKVKVYKKVLRCLIFFTIFLIFIVFYNSKSYAQENRVIKIVVYDYIKKKPVPNAKIVFAYNDKRLTRKINKIFPFLKRVVTTNGQGIVEYKIKRKKDHITYKIMHDKYAEIAPKSKKIQLKHNIIIDTIWLKPRYVKINAVLVDKYTHKVITNRYLGGSILNAKTIHPVINKGHITIQLPYKNFYDLKFYYTQKTRKNLYNDTIRLKFDTTNIFNDTILLDPKIKPIYITFLDPFTLSKVKDTVKFSLKILCHGDSIRTINFSYNGHTAIIEKLSNCDHYLLTVGKTKNNLCFKDNPKREVFLFYTKKNIDTSSNNFKHLHDRYLRFIKKFDKRNYCIHDTNLKDTIKVFEDTLKAYIQNGMLLYNASQYFYAKAILSFIKYKFYKDISYLDTIKNYLNLAVYTYTGKQGWTYYQCGDTGTRLLQWKIALEDVDTAGCTHCTYISNPQIFDEFAIYDDHSCPNEPPSNEKDVVDLAFNLVSKGLLKFDCAGLTKKEINRYNLELRNYKTRKFTPVAYRNYLLAKAILFLQEWKILPNDQKRTKEYLLDSSLMYFRAVDKTIKKESNLQLMVRKWIEFLEPKKRSFIGCTNCHSAYYNPLAINGKCNKSTDDQVQEIQNYVSSKIKGNENVKAAIVEDNDNLYLAILIGAKSYKIGHYYSEDLRILIKTFFVSAIETGNLKNISTIFVDLIVFGSADAYPIKGAGIKYQDNFGKRFKNKFVVEESYEKSEAEIMIDTLINNYNIDTKKKHYDKITMDKYFIELLNKPTQEIEVSNRIYSNLELAATRAYATEFFIKDFIYKGLKIKFDTSNIKVVKVYTKKGPEYRTTKFLLRIPNYFSDLQKRKPKYLNISREDLYNP